jgi:murein DD-endopeptidase MepM/ murein hydrolase activator NlpD
MKGSNIAIAVIVVAIVALLVYYTYFRMSTFSKPVTGRISSKFGNRTHPISGVLSFHNGIDIAAPTGTPIQAPLDGEILRIWDGGAGGKSMQVVHAGGWITGYAHLSSYNKVVGDKVKKGEAIAFVGNTGSSTGPHLHFTLTTPKSLKVDPEAYFGKKLV